MNEMSLTQIILGILGRSGIVVKVELASWISSVGKPINYLRDDFGNEPQLIIFRAPMGIERKALSGLETVEVEDDNGEYRQVQRYKEYKVGEDFP